MLSTIGVLSILALAAPTFGIYASLIVQLGVEIQALLTITAQLNIQLPTLALSLQVLLDILVELQADLQLTLPSVSLYLSLQAELAILLGIVAALQLSLSVAAVGGIYVLTYGGPGNELGSAISGSGAFTTAPVTAIILGATSSAAFAAMTEIFNGVPFGPGLNVVGELTFSAFMASTFTLLASLFGEFNSRYKAMLSASARISVEPPTVAASVTLAAQIEASLKAGIQFGMPEVSAALVASVQARIALIASLIAQINAALSWGTDGFDVLKYVGAGNGMGAALTSELSGQWPDGVSATQPSNVIILAGTTPAASAALTSFFAAAA
jgi:hypothetical protein